MKSKRGITLIELLITIVLIGAILIVITSVYVTGYRTFKEQLSSSMVQSNAQTILDAIILDAKNGMLILDSYTNGAKTYTTDAQTIIIQVPSVKKKKNVLYGDGSADEETNSAHENESSAVYTDMLYDTIIYYYANHEIHKVTFAVPKSSRYKNNRADSTLDKNILSLGFVYDPPDPGNAHLVKVTLHSDIKVGSRNEQITITGEARLRNHI